MTAFNVKALMMQVLLQVSEDLRQPIDVLALEQSASVALLVLAGFEAEIAVEVIKTAIAHGWDIDWVRDWITTQQALAAKLKLRQQLAQSVPSESVSTIAKAQGLHLKRLPQPKGFSRV